MNQQRRKEIRELIEKLTEVKELIESNALNPEEEYYENIPENLQESERATASADAIEYLQSSLDSVEEAIDNLESSIES